MKVAIAGLWHLGTVTAACAAAAGHNVTAYDDAVDVVDGLAKGRMPIAEPDLDKLVAEGSRTGRLAFTSDPGRLAGNQALWICWDTPVDDSDIADVEFVVGRVLDLLPRLDEGTLVLISSQLPAGTTARLEREHLSRPGARKLAFAYSPENLRLGRAIEAFRNPDRIVVGVRTPETRTLVCNVFGELANRIEWMSVESAEMTKHALNAFLGTSIAFINEIATLCEKAGADALDVARALKSEGRIGPRAYLNPGGAFAGGTLARDIAFLLEMGKASGTPARLLEGVQESNERHKEWALRQISEVAGNPQGKTIAVLGLTYKPGTNTLRRSSAIEFCRALSGAGARMRGYDPALPVLPAEAADLVHLAGTAADALMGADVALISGAWPEFRTLTAADFVERMRTPVLLDPTRCLEKLGSDPRIRYISIGKTS